MQLQGMDRVDLVQMLIHAGASPYAMDSSAGQWWKECYPGYNQKQSVVKHQDCLNRYILEQSYMYLRTN